MLDMSNCPPEVYATVCPTLKIPVLGGQAPPQADGKIQSATGSGYYGGDIDRTDSHPNMQKFLYDYARITFDDIHAGQWNMGHLTNSFEKPS